MGKEGEVEVEEEVLLQVSLNNLYFFIQLVAMQVIIFATFLRCVLYSKQSLRT